MRTKRSNSLVVFDNLHILVILVRLLVFLERFTARFVGLLLDSA